MGIIYFTKCVMNSHLTVHSRTVNISTLFHHCLDNSTTDDNERLSHIRCLIVTVCEILLDLKSSAVMSLQSVLQKEVFLHRNLTRTIYQTVDNQYKNFIKHVYNTFGFARWAVH